MLEGLHREKDKERDSVVLEKAQQSDEKPLGHFE